MVDIGDSDQEQNVDGVAIIGMAGRFPGANTIEEFWSNICNGRESIVSFTDEELKESGIAQNLLDDPNYVKAGSILKDASHFDNEFFGMTPRDAEITDPQHRIFIETAWHALEHAGYNPEKYSGGIGVYAGAFLSTYLLNLYSHKDLLEAIGIQTIRQANDKDHLATTVSYKLNLTGPSLAVQTACSTSLVAVHVACQALLSGECDMALAGGVCVWFPEKNGYLFQKGSIGSPDGHTRTFDARAQGTVFGHGVGLVVLKRLADALAEGDTIYAVIKGSAINNDGSAKVGYTAPGVEGQAKVITEAMGVAGVHPRSIGYVEAHGTATPIGDPVEIAALKRAFRSGTNDKGFCAIGSVKTNIGHLSVAAGIASLIKTAFMCHYKLIPPSLFYEQPNPEIDFANSPFYVNTMLRPWESGASPRRAGVSSFGIGGTNAHMVLQEAPQIQPAQDATHSWQILPISARSSSALDTATTQLATYLQEHADVALKDVAHTLQVGRKAFSHRRVLVSSQREDAIQALQPLDFTRILTAQNTPAPSGIVFMFPGGGAQYVEMGKNLYQQEPVFRAELDRCANLMRTQLGLDIRDVLYPETEQEENARQLLRRTSLALPALFVTEYALAQLWKSWGVKPAALIGHSLGEYVAACLAGIFTLEDALALVIFRGRLLEQLPKGAMLSAALSEEEADALLNGDISIAAINTPSQRVFSGNSEVIDKLEQALRARDVQVSRLHIDVAAHSHLIAPIMQAFTGFVSTLQFNKPFLPLVSNVTGTWMTEAEATNPHYWVNHLRQTVRFSDGIKTLLQTPNRIFLEVGPGQTLQTFIQQYPVEGSKPLALSSVRHSQNRTHDRAFILNTIGRLWLAGTEIDWDSLAGKPRPRRIPLPLYPFERQRYWIDQKQVDEPAFPQQQKAQKKTLAEWFYATSWKRSAISTIHTSAHRSLGTCLVLHTDDLVGQALVRQLKAAGYAVISVLPGVSFTRQDETCYLVNPLRHDDYKTLLNALATHQPPIQVILHAWCATAETPFVSKISDWEHAQESGFYSLLTLIQSLANTIELENVRIEVLTSGAQLVSGQEQLHPERATLLALTKVIAQEYPQLQCRCIDIEVAPSDQQADHLARQLLAEWHACLPDRLIAYRSNYRWIPIFEPFTLDAAESNARLRYGGVYLIVDGLTQAGLALADYLARELHAKIALITSDNWPERVHWEQWLTLHNEDNLISRAIRQILGLEAIGAEILVNSADTAQIEQMRDAMAEIERRFGTLHGVIQVASPVQSGIRPISELEYAEIAQHFRPKVHGLLVLDQLLNTKSLDFHLVISSLSSLLGGQSHAADAAAYAFVDAFIQARSQRDSRPYLVLNSAKWHLPEQYKEHESLMAFGKNMLELFVSPDEGIEIVKRVLAWAAGPQVIASRTDLNHLSHRFEHPAHPDQVQESTNDPLIHHARPNLQSTYVAPRTPREKQILVHWQNMLGIDQIGVYDNFFELGGHSLVGTQIITWLRKTFDVELPLRVIFESPTIADIARVIEEHTKADIPPKAPQTIPSIKREARLLQRLDDGHRAKIMTDSAPRPAAVNALAHTFAALEFKKHAQFSLFFFSADVENQQAGYQLILESAKFADQHNFTAIWTPERHFNAFGGLYPNPSVLSAALAMITKQIQLRAGSVVLPLHNPIRVAEEWAVVDNLSGGRIGIAIASGWHSTDFVLAPAAYATRKSLLFEGIRQLQAIWRGEEARLPGGAGHLVEITTFPRPVQKNLPLWISGESMDTFIAAGEIGAHVLTALLHQEEEELARKIEAYRKARAANGFDPQEGQVALMLHTYVGQDEQQVHEQARRAYMDYIKTHMGLHASNALGLGLNIDIREYSEADLDFIARNAFERLCKRGAMIGTPERCLENVQRFSAIGVNEIACLIDFGLETELVIDGLKHLRQLMALS